MFSRESLVQLSVGFISRDPKLGKWMIVGNIATYLSVCVTDQVLKTPKFIVEIKELNVDISKDGGSKSSLLVRLQVLPTLVGEPQGSRDLLSNLTGGGCNSSGQASIAALERSSAPFICEKFFVLCEFGHDREVGIVIKNVDISNREVTMNLNDELLLKRKSPSKTSSGSDNITWSHANLSSTQRPSKKQQTLAAFSKYSYMFPEKVGFNLPKWMLLGYALGNLDHAYITVVRCCCSSQNQLEAAVPPKINTPLPRSIQCLQLEDAPRLDEPCCFQHALLRLWPLVCGHQGLCLPTPFGIWVERTNGMVALLAMVTYDDAKGVAYSCWIQIEEREDFGGFMQAILVKVAGFHVNNGPDF
ncbi:hypothetical protein VNO77_07980 [Canavalia gladiata]|uniref:Uncharacterized protein n=1 Tax=Canavalia gladiata TaxID=3824 RepID=A0AAN9M821_CANGL